ncbi:MAG: hypothetical protein ACYC0I_10085 [Acidimicrobiales bacterium]
MKSLRVGLLIAAMFVAGLVAPIQTGAATLSRSYQQTLTASTWGGAAFSYGINATWSWTATLRSVSKMEDMSCVGKHSTFYTITSISCTAKAGPNGSYVVTDTMTQKSPRVCLPGGFCTPSFSQTITDVREILAPDLVITLSQTV